MQIKTKNKGYYLNQKRILLPIISTILANAAFAQTVIKGKIDGTQPGTAVKNINTNNSSITDANGNFFIIGKIGDTLVVNNPMASAPFTFILNDSNHFAINTQEINKTAIDTTTKTAIAVQADTSVQKNKDLDEVVVVGFGTQKKSNLTNAIGIIDKKTLENRPTRNVLQSIQGVMPGLNISQNTGSLSSTPSVNIRGIGSISSSSSASPLILIDGMEGDINSLNPQDVENITVLKDASSSAIYGSRAAFGVILVTTKSGSKGKIQVNYNNNIRSSSPINMPQMMNSYEFAQYFNEAAVNSGSNGFFDSSRMARIKAFLNGTLKATTIAQPNNSSYWGDGYAYGNDNVDWYKAIYRAHSLSYEHNLSVNGGNDKTQYYISGNYMHQMGQMVFNPDYLNRYTLSAKITSQLSNILKLDYSSRFIRTEFQRPSALTDGLFNDLARQGWPMLPLYDPNGYLFSSPSPALGLRDGGKDRTTNDWLYQQLQLAFEPIKGWRTVGTINYRTNYNFRHYDTQQTYNHDVSGNPYLYGTSSGVYEYGYKNNYFNGNIYSEYTKAIGSHHFKAMAGFQTELSGYNDLSVYRVGIIDSAIATINTTNGLAYNGTTVVPTISGQYQHWATAGFFGRFNYDYAGKYLMEANIRRDGSSRFRRFNRWGTFPSISFGWLLSKESFWINSKISNIVSTLKFRASYGTLGNQATNDWYPTYQTMPNYTSSGTWLINNSQPTVAYSPALISPNLTWETVKSYDAGVDFGLFNDKLTGTFDIYNRKTLNMVGPATSLPEILGTTVPPSNNTNLKTKGWELQLTWKDNLSNGLSYGFTASLSDYLTFVTKYPNPTGSLGTYRADSKNPIGQIWGYETVGIAKTAQEMADHLSTMTAAGGTGQNSLGNNWSAGDIMYKDQNGDGTINTGNYTVSSHGDLKVIGNTSPRYNYSLNAFVNYKGFDFSVFFQGIGKRDMWQDSYMFWGVTNDMWWSTGLKQHLNYFRGDASNPLGQNLNAYYPRPVFSNKNHAVQTKYLLNAAYLRLKNIQLGYTLPNSLVQKCGLTKVRFYVSGENLFVITKMPKMYDPETVSYSTGFYTASTYPLSKILSGGVSITF